MKIRKNQKDKMSKDEKDTKDNNIDKKRESNVLSKGKRTLKDILAPPSFDRSEADHIKVGNKAVRNFTVNGYPSSVHVGWLDALYNYDGDMDIALYVEPSDERGALDELTRKIAQFEADLMNQREKGNIKNITRLQNNIHQLYDLREQLEQNYENLFYIQPYFNLYADNKEELDKRTQMLDNKLKGQRISILPTYLRQDDGYKSALPFGQMYMNDNMRNFNSGALTACFPFYNSEITHENGVFMGVNLSTATPVLVDYYDRKMLPNSNLTVFGKSGSGKTFFVSLLTLRSLLKGIRTVIVDPEGEYQRLSKAVGGTHIYIAPDSDTKINPFDLEEEDETDDYGRPTGYKLVRIKDKVSDALNLIGVMAGGLSREQSSLVAAVIDELYQEKGFTEDSESLYITDASFDAETGEFYHQGRKKPMPTFTDFHDKLEEMAVKEGSDDLKSLANALRIFKKGGVYDMFDCQTSGDIDFKNAPLITFDISKLEENVLRPIGMYIALTWTWEKFIKKDPATKKRIVCDEAWMLVNKSMAGHEYTSAFLDKAARRIRKRNGGLLVASQNFIEFYDNDQGRAVLTNAAVNIFLKQDASDVEAVQSTFKLSDGEKNFLLSAKTGELLLKMDEESSVVYALSFPYEASLITGN